MSGQSFDVKIAANGRMVLPARIRAALGLKGDARLTLTLDDGEIVIQPARKRVLRARALFNEHARQSRTVDEFLADRKEEQERRDSLLSGQARA